MNDPKAVQLLLSIGTGRNLEPDGHKGTGWAMYHSYVNAAAKWATQSQGTHHTMQYFTQGVAEYCRLNVKEGLGKMKLDECKGDGGQKTLEYIHRKTAAYLELPAVRKKITAMAKQLVDIRRARSSYQDRDHWERFCHGVEYACAVDGCHWGRHRFHERRDLQRHFEDDHTDCDKDNLESLLDKGKRFYSQDAQERERTPSQESDSS